MLQSRRLAKQGPILGIIHELQFHPRDSAAPLELCFCVLWHQQKHLFELCLVFSYRQHSLLSGFFQNSISQHIPSALGRKALDRAGGASNAFFSFYRASVNVLSPQTSTSAAVALVQNHSRVQHRSTAAVTRCCEMMQADYSG